MELDDWAGLLHSPTHPVYIISLHTYTHSSIVPKPKREKEDEEHTNCTIHPLNIEPILNRHRQTMQRPHHLPIPNPVLIQLSRLRESPIEENLRQTLGQLLSDGGALTERGGQFLARYLARREEGNEFRGVLGLGPLQFLGCEDVACSNCGECVAWGVGEG